jgi:hypothetical protein
METTGIKENIKEYIQTQIDIVKLKAINKGGEAISGVIVGITLGVLGFFIIFFLSFSAAYGISSASGHPFLGFLLVAAFYILLAVLIIVFKDKFITLPIINTLLKKFYFRKDRKDKSD